MVGNNSEGARKDRSNGAVPESNVKGSKAVGDVIRQQDMGGHRRNSQGPDGVPSLGGATDHGDDGKTWGKSRLGVPSGR